MSLLLETSPSAPAKVTVTIDGHTAVDAEPVMTSCGFERLLDVGFGVWCFDEKTEDVEARVDSFAVWTE